MANNPHFEKLRESLAKDTENKKTFRRRFDEQVDPDTDITDPYSCLEDSDFCVTNADEDVEDAAWGRMIRREAPSYKNGRGNY